MFRQFVSLLKINRSKCHHWSSVGFSSTTGSALEPIIPPEVEVGRAKDMPVQLSEDPYQKPKPQCILCKYKIQVDYKNTRLLSQFVSRFSGKVYQRHVTRLCEYQQKKVEREVAKARSSGLMPSYFKEPMFAEDPDLFNPDQPLRNHPF